MTGRPADSWTVGKTERETKHNRSNIRVLTVNVNLVALFN